MSTREAARRILRDAETALRKVMQDGLREQRYKDVSEVAQLTDGVARLLGSNPSVTPYSSTTPSGTLERAAPQSSRPKSSNPRTVKNQDKAKYPRFEREGDRLIKVGWSKKHREEYEHRAPRDAVAAFARHLAGTVPEGHVFVVEDLMPVPGVNGDDEVPAYQVYLTLKWFQDVGAVEKKGRDGYVLRNGGLSESGVDDYWTALPVRKA